MALNGKISWENDFIFASRLSFFSFMSRDDCLFRSNGNELVKAFKIELFFIPCVDKLLSFLSKNLYNYCNYLLRQEYINDGKLATTEYGLTGKLAKENQADFRALPATTSLKKVGQ